MIEAGSSGNDRLPAGRQRAWVAVVVVVALAVCPATASAGVEASSSTASGGVAERLPRSESGLLRVAVEGSIADAKLLRSWIEERNAGVVETIPEVEGHEQWIAVAVSGSTYEYRVWVVAMRDGVPAGVVEDADACVCNTETLLALVDERVAEQVTVLREVSGGVVRVPRVKAAAPRGAAVATGVVAGTGSRDRSRESVDRGRRLRLHAVGYVGIGAAVLGAGMIAVGVPFTQKPDEIDGTQGHLWKQSWRGLGVGLAASGSVVFATGVSLLVVNLVRQRSREVAVVPMLDPRQLGVAIAWRARRRVRR